MIASLIIIGSILFIGIGLICFNIKIGYFKIIQRLKAGQENRGFLKELYSNGDIFDYSYLVPFTIDKIDNKEIDTYINKHNFFLQLSLIAIFLVFFLIIIGTIIGVK